MTFKPAHRRIITLSVGVVLLVAFIVAGSTLRVPYIALGPGVTVNTLGDFEGKRVVKVSDAVDPNPKGNLNLTTVSLYDGLTLFDALGMWISGSYELAPRDLYYPPDQTVEQVQEQNTAQMAGSEANATMAAMQYLNKPVALGVGDVAKKGPSAGKLLPSDRVISVDGTPINGPQALFDVLAKKKPGDEIAVVVQRRAERLTQQVTLGARPDDAERPYLGITPQMVPADPNTNIVYSVGAIGGPSAGLMLTLSVIDQMTPGNLTHGKFVAGTGTIDPSGKVGPIGGIEHKIKAARDAGATVFLVPADNCAAATSDTPDGVELVKVENLTGAMDALATLDTDKSRPSC
ncbi:PDZ domain-containing protein [Gordonia sp. (in: high G+C Gram-positive bacteria)]|uniref:YlbL family protein n=1 Tax=Gordonia sp. (in: high G+C Gram-positive bacteria) TaxID=84139 RepID=UPI00169EDD2F|nr:PDZ domain-containing protein [Gordonia sp. (in: high G+C Gram-positive bacteria)]NLG45913.1 PDZ domain-containing protein [Gordonia sp. (in: high G+C Gram-positive bacteria)]